MPCCISAHSTICQSQTGIQFFLVVSYTIWVCYTFFEAGDASLWQAMLLQRTRLWCTLRSLCCRPRTLWQLMAFREFLSTLWERGDREQFWSFWVECPLVEHLPPLAPISDSWRWSLAGATHRVHAGRVCSVRSRPGWLPVSFPGAVDSAGCLAWGRRRPDATSETRLSCYSLQSGPASSTRRSITDSWRRRGDHSSSIPVLARVAAGSAGLACPQETRPGCAASRAQRSMQTWLAWAADPRHSHVPDACARCGDKAEFHCHVCDESFCSQCGGE